MTRASKALFGIAGFLPLVVTLLFFASFLYIAVSNTAAIANLFTNHSGLVLLGNIFLAILTTAPVILFIVHAARSPQLEHNRVTWILLLIFLGGCAMPFYWYAYVLHEGVSRGSNRPLGLHDQ